MFTYKVSTNEVIEQIQGNAISSRLFVQSGISLMSGVCLILLRSLKEYMEIEALVGISLNSSGRRFFFTWGSH